MCPESKLAERVLRRVQKGDSCWLWTGSVSNRGYGQLDVRDAETGAHRVRFAHRLVYELLAGPIPPDLVIDHLCRVPLCVNPSHLEPVTNRENILRGTSPSAMSARRDRCVHGHALVGENLRVNRRGDRACRACYRARQAAYWRRKSGSKATSR